jgi:hypothetical protein
MAWRTLAVENCEWSVSVAVERRPGSNDWTLVAGFRSSSPEPRRYWIPLPVSSSSKAALFAHADSLSHEDLVGLLRAQLAG